MGLFNPAGGLIYHFRALRHRDKEWWPFRVSIGRWTGKWVPKSSAVVLIGPSAGYCIPGSLLSRFQYIMAFEPDRLARRLFKKNHPTARVEWASRADFLQVVRKERGDRTKILRRFGLPEDTAFVFPNFLGQVEFLSRTSDEDLKRIAEVVFSGPFLTFHDRLNASWSLKEGAEVFESFGRASAEDLAKAFLKEPLSKSATAIEEHSLEPFIERLKELGVPLDRLEWTYWPWKFRQDRVQIVEGVAWSPKDSNLLKS